MDPVNVMWFRRGLRFHDNPAFLEAVRYGKRLLPIYIFDTTFICGKILSFHQMGYLLEALSDLNERFSSFGSRLYVFRGCPLEIFEYLHSILQINNVFCEHDCEPSCQQRDTAVREICEKHGSEFIDKVSHTLWNPLDIINANGGTPPLTYEMFVHAALSVGDPDRPVDDISLQGVGFVHLDDRFPDCNFRLFDKVPQTEEVGVPQIPVTLQKRRIIGGERQALVYFASRVQIEEEAFRKGYYQPNQARPDLMGPPLSLSTALALGCISVRLFYWSLWDLYNSIFKGSPPASFVICAQLIWREYFYTMSRGNPHYDRIENNPICLKIQWLDDEHLLNCWKEGKTGYPFIDAAMRQLAQEGWMHHAARNAVALFLTRGDLWVNWEPGADWFMEQLVDADWAVNSGNWLWVSSSAFERVLNCSVCISPVTYGRRLEPTGEYIKRYVPELSGFSPEFVHEPWKAPQELQAAANCVIGRDYPQRLVIHEDVSRRNQQWMLNFRLRLLEAMKATPPHCKPSSEEEVYHFLCIPEECYHNVK